MRSDGPIDGSALVTASGLTKRYPKVTALDSLTVTIAPGIIGLVGPNGAGKSTFIKILLGLLSPTSGTATLLGFDATRQDVDLRQYVGYMPEHDCLPLEISATEFIVHMAQISGLPHAAARERAAETLRQVGLFEERYRQMREYSTGMKQRVKLAQALVHDPRLMLLDEPTVGLDPGGRDEMLDLVQRVGREFGISIIMSSHLLGEIERVCDHLMQIESGKLVRYEAISALTDVTQVLTVEVEGDVSPLVERLRNAGFTVQQDDRRVHVQLDDDRVYDVIRDTVAEMGMGLVRLQQQRRRLEEIFGERAVV
ncbi:MAG: ABC transporter ATP-binding protein [Chloroflexota bacterium]